MYRSGKLTGTYKQLILAQRDTITYHRDNTIHSDRELYRSSDCSHTDVDLHTDEGIGVDFPIF